MLEQKGTQHPPPTLSQTCTTLKAARQIGHEFAFCDHSRRHSSCRIWPHGLISAIWASPSRRACSRCLSSPVELTSATASGGAAGGSISTIWRSSRQMIHWSVILKRYRVDASSRENHKCWSSKGDGGCAVRWVVHGRRCWRCCCCCRRCEPRCLREGNTMMRIEMKILDRGFHREAEDVRKGRVEVQEDG